MAKTQIHTSVEIETDKQIDAIKDFYSQQGFKVSRSQTLEKLILKGIEAEGFVFADTKHGLIADKK